MLGVRRWAVPRWKRVAVGLGSSAGSADASSVAVNEIFGRKLGADDLVLAGLTRGRKFGLSCGQCSTGDHGGFVLIRSYDLLELIPLKFPSEKELFLFLFLSFFFFLCVLFNPEFEVPTKKMRVALSSEIGMLNYSRAGALVALVLQGDLRG
ncbi:hypothetical protein VitviT2T_011374 [Vitis vinifera]|uniref:GHMP kinase N-terminal domain-containing protein n=1 Tax=Vitis vinifera TaxID=29760 RepID=A0ABY9CBD1_VITVI|nr:hypothetical protein VitviT2T_011374 [Vitis vinifera]